MPGRAYRVIEGIGRIRIDAPVALREQINHRGESTARGAPPRMEGPIVKKLLIDFRNFLLQGDLILLAVAFIMGAAFKSLLDSLINDLITPIISLIFGKPSFDSMSFTINGSKFLYGSFLTQTISFLTIGFAVYFFIAKPYEMFKNRKTTDPTEKDCPECTSSIPIRATRCPQCTAVIG
jgi:large conductance mechanosensitive channel